jgi:hypothetical protein
MKTIRTSPRQCLLLATVLMACLAVPVHDAARAQDKAPALDEVMEKAVAAVEADFDESLKDLGELAGEVFSCVQDKDKRATHVERVDSVHGELNKLFGTDRAFLFAAYFGYGSASEQDEATCSELTDEFEDRYGAITKKYDLID